MSKKASPAAIGGFVLGALALLVIGILVFSSGALFRQKNAFVSYFPGTVAGLNVGAPVQFQGVQIGEVIDVNLDYFPNEGRFSIPVYYDIWPSKLHTYDAETAPADRSAAKRVANIRALIEKHGLRAQLTSLSLVTGQYVVSLEMKPGTKFKYVGTNPDAIEIPTLESARDKVSDLLQGLDLKSLVKKGSDALDGITAFVNDPAIKALPENLGKTITDARTLIDNLDAELKPLVARVDATLADYDALAKIASARIGTLADALEDTAGKVGVLSSNVNAKVDPLVRSANGALDSAHEAFDTIGEMVSSDSATRSNLDQMLEEAAGAARSLRILADYLEQNPDALIKGKY